MLSLRHDNVWVCVLYRSLVPYEEELGDSCITIALTELLRRLYVLWALDNPYREAVCVPDPERGPNFHA